MGLYQDQAGSFAEAEALLGVIYLLEGKERIGIFDRVNKRIPMQEAGYTGEFDCKVVSTKPQFEGALPETHQGVTHFGKEYTITEMEEDEEHFTFYLLEMQ